MGSADVRGGFALLLLLVVVGVTGCGRDFEDEEPPAPPTRAELERFVAETRQPAYWLGPRFRGIAVSHASAGRWGARLTYGRWTCDTGCTDEGGVSTQRRSMDDLAPYPGDPVIYPKRCWTRVRKAVAVLIGCFPGGYPQELVVYSGTHEILVTSLITPHQQREFPARAVVRGLRPLNARAAWPLEPPARLTCREFSRVDRRYRQHMPRPLRPLADC